MHFSQAVSIMQSQVTVMKKVHVIYNDQDPLASDLILSLPQDGLRLLFDSTSQRLKIIEIFNMRFVKLRYCGIHFNTPEITPTIDQIDQSFGATHPGVYNEDKQMFALNFRGLSFEFPVEQASEPRFVRGVASFQFPSGCSPTASRMCVFQGAQMADCKAPPLPLSCFFAHPYLQNLEVIRDNATRRTLGLRLAYVCEGSAGVLEPKKQTVFQEVRFGQSGQDILSALGTPSRIFYKDDDKMRIHSPQPHRRVPGAYSDYFFNYFTLGFDLLFDGSSHLLKKIVLHTNYPGHYNFNMYHRCEFQLQLSADKVMPDVGHLLDVNQPVVMVTAYSRWDSIVEKLNPSESPIVLKRASSTNTVNPFGSTLCYGYQDIIFEVMTNNYIASVTVYSSECVTAG
nr:EOG090X06XP [Triops cancriformis]